MVQPWSLRGGPRDSGHLGMLRASILWAGGRARRLGALSPHPPPEAPRQLEWTIHCDGALWSLPRSGHGPPGASLPGIPVSFPGLPHHADGAACPVSSAWSLHDPTLLIYCPFSALRPLTAESAALLRVRGEMPGPCWSSPFDSTVYDSRSVTQLLGLGTSAGVPQRPIVFPPLPVPTRGSLSGREHVGAVALDNGGPVATSRW